MIFGGIPHLIKHEHISNRNQMSDFTDSKSLSDAREVPDLVRSQDWGLRVLSRPYRFDSKLCNRQLTSLVETNFTIRHTVEWSDAAAKFGGKALTDDLLLHSVLTREAGEGVSLESRRSPSPRIPSYVP